MPKKTGNGLGRGFFDLFEDNLPQKGGNDNSQVMIRVADIEPRSDQPRKNFDHEALESLADSISEFGLLQPIIVRENPYSPSTYEIIAGERRYRAAKMAGLNEVPCVVMSTDDLKTSQISIIENVQRENLNPIEEAAAYKVLLDSYGVSQEELAKQVNKNRSTIANMIRLLDLPAQIQADLAEGKITTGHARPLLSIKDEEDQIKLEARIIEEGLSVRSVEKIVNAYLARSESEDKQDLTEEKSEAKMRRAYMKALEGKAQELLGRKVRIVQTAKKKVIEISYVDDSDLGDALVKMCGDRVLLELK
ncbi:MAG: ParB/RepB/Spo0J family partition protein [Clostridia bacterium]|nr:ParB/RepB/Spo0J family partition protein [Clostridia bacterium]MBQ3928005.1 ParB/RepB/Spo0J family partition protein [Clostridia bacterium]